MKVLIIHDMPLQPYRIYDYNELSARGYDITGGYFFDYHRDYNIPINFKLLPLFCKKCGGFTIITNFKEVCIDDYDIIIFAPNLRVLNFYSLYRKKYRDKVILWGHMKGHSNNNMFASIIRNYLCRKYKSLIFYESNTKEEYVKKGFPVENLFVANNTQYVDNSNINIDNSRNDFIYVGRIQERKRVDIALKAFKILSERHINSRFLVVGGGDTSSLAEIVKNDNIKNVVFMGAIYDENKLHEVFSNAIAYVSPGHVGLGVLQSLGHGVPVITCINQPHAPEIINCNVDNSFLVPLTVEDVADAMLKLCNDKKLQKKMAHAALNYYNTYCTIEKMMDGVESAIAHLIDNAN